MTVLYLDHVSLPVAELDRSVHFYGRVLGLETVPRPAFAFPGAWFKLGPGQTLHLIEAHEATVPGGSRSHHFALRVASVEAAAEALREAGLSPMRGPKQRPDGVWQVFYQDPDGHYLELTEATPGLGSV
ncbi:MAG: VOC family protein [Bacteroidota bacterium]